LKHQIEIPPAPIGIHHLKLARPLSVERGDFLGVHYPRSARSGVIAHAIAADNALSAGEMFQTLVVDIYEGDIPTDRTIDLTRFPQRVESRTFALVAVLGSMDAGNEDLLMLSCVLFS